MGHDHFSDYEEIHMLRESAEPRTTIKATRGFRSLVSELDGEGLSAILKKALDNHRHFSKDEELVILAEVAKRLGN